MKDCVSTIGSLVAMAFVVACVAIGPMDDTTAADKIVIAGNDAGSGINSGAGQAALALVGALLPAAFAQRANADPTDYWDFEYPLGSRPRPAPELLSHPQGVLINQPLASNYNPTLALNVAPGDQPGGFQPLQVDADFFWTGTVNSTWITSGNWLPSGPPSSVRSDSSVSPISP